MSGVVILSVVPLSPCYPTSPMKGYWGHLEKNRPGTIKLTPEDTDDIWNLYNIISIGDEIESSTIR